MTPSVIKCDLIAFVNVNGRYDGLIVHCAKISVSLFDQKENAGMPGGRSVTRKVIVLSAMGHNCSLIKYHLSK